MAPSVVFCTCLMIAACDAWAISTRFSVGTPFRSTSGVLLITASQGVWDGSYEFVEDGPRDTGLFLSGPLPISFLDNSAAAFAKEDNRESDPNIAAQSFITDAAFFCTSG